MQSPHGIYQKPVSRDTYQKPRKNHKKNSRNKLEKPRKNLEKTTNLFWLKKKASFSYHFLLTAWQHEIFLSKPKPVSRTKTTKKPRKKHEKTTKIFRKKPRKKRQKTTNLFQPKKSWFFRGFFLNTGFGSISWPFMNTDLPLLLRALNEGTHSLLSSLNLVL